MKANRTYTQPPTIEDLGDGTYYYNFRIVESTVTPEEGGPYVNYDYEQVRCNFPLDENEIQNCVDAEGYQHTVNIEVE